MNNPSLIYIPQVKISARFRMICFPYAGGGSATYRSWVNNMPENVELALIQMPGRASRFTEAPYETMAALVNDIFIALNQLTKKELIFYGHSMGACVAYELTLKLYRHKCSLPIHVVASGSVAPCVIRTKEPSYKLPTAEFIEYLRDLKGTTEDVLKNAEIMELLLPSIRADFKIIETYCNKTTQNIPTNVSVFCGKNDDIGIDDLSAWLTLFKFNTGIHWFDGGHFFVDDEAENILTALSKIVSSVCNCE